MTRGPGPTMTSISRVLASADGPLTAIDITRAIHAARGERDSQPSRTLTQNVHKALRTLTDRGDVVRLPVQDQGTAQWAFALASSDDLVTRLTPAVVSSARRLTQRDYVAVVAALVDALPVEEARGLVDMLNDRLARR